ncbi:MAG: NAD(P)/FAD-dependent oxidoreductase [Myxococcales bacterium]
MESFDALVVGGGPSGSNCARTLVQGGMRVAVLDAAKFPRVKLCAGWVSPPVWDQIGLSPREYPRGLWQWNRMHVHYAGRTHAPSCSGWLIRRVEFDDFLLQRSGAEVREHRVQKIARDGDGFVVDGRYRARVLVGAGGTNCPVARLLFPRKERKPVATQEREFEGTARHPGRDGEPEILVHDDLGGYSWSIPKKAWMNVGCGTVEPKALLPAWSVARGFFEQEKGPLPALDQVKGHSYHLFRGEHLAACARDGAFVAGDALGLAHPFTGEGILPAVTSGRLCAKAILTGADYRKLVESEPLFQDYRILAGLIELLPKGRTPRPRPALAPVIAKLFALAFSARPLPARRAIAWWQRHG